MKNISFRNDVLPLKNELYRLALRITMSTADAEDIVQETMIKVWNRRERWQEIDSIEAFSMKICRNLALDVLRNKNHQNPSLEQHMLVEPTAGTDPQDKTIQQDRIRVVRQIINSLPEKQRSCMQLRDFEGKSYKEIATILDISEDQVKVNIFRARQTIKQKYKQIEDYGL
jgi:RNA polymerase sigma-70 factor (ECF subfamily)